MACNQNSFALVGKHMQRRVTEPAARLGKPDMPTISDLIRRIDHALQQRRAA